MLYGVAGELLNYYVLIFVLKFCLLYNFECSIKLKLKT